MIDVSYNIPRLPRPEDPLDYIGANAIEHNLFALIRAWPVFESVQTAPSIGSYGYLQLDETGTPADGVEVTFLQYLPRILVLLEGNGLENVTWHGKGWLEENGALVYTLSEISLQNANAALKQLYFSAAGEADITIAVAGENLGWEPGSLRLYGEGRTRLLFWGRATWGLARVKKLTWGGARPLTWGEAAALRKD